MGSRSWTELFFLDEATAFAAGHRPCFYCRRDDANRFRAAWEKGNGFADVLARDIDAVLHRERLDRGEKRLHPLPMPLEQLPDGAMVQADEESYLIVQGRALLWSMAGYRKSTPRSIDAMLLTPPSTLRALDAGYRPVLHPSAIAKFSLHSHALATRISYPGSNGRPTLTRGLWPGLRQGAHDGLTRLAGVVYPSRCRASFAPAPSAISLASAISRRIGAMPQLVVATMLLFGTNFDDLRRSP